MKPDHIDIGVFIYFLTFQSKTLFIHVFSSLFVAFKIRYYLFHLIICRFKGHRALNFHLTGKPELSVLPVMPIPIMESASPADDCGNVNDGDDAGETT